MLSSSVRMPVKHALANYRMFDQADRVFRRVSLGTRTARCAPRSHKPLKAKCLTRSFSKVPWRREVRD